MEPNPLLVTPNPVLPAIAGPERGRGKKTRSKRRKNAGGQGRKKAGIVDSKNHVSDKIIDDFTRGGNDLITYDDENLKKYCSDMYRANMTRSPKLLHNFKTKARLNFETRNLEVKPPVGELKLDPFDHQVHKEIALYYKGLGDIIVDAWWSKPENKSEKQSKMKSLHTLVVRKIDALYRDQKAKKAQKKAAKKAKPRKPKVVASIESNENKEEAANTDVYEDDANKLIVDEKLSETESVHQHGGGEKEAVQEIDEDSEESEDEEVQVHMNEKEAVQETDEDSEESETEPVEADENFKVNAVENDNTDYQHPWRSFQHKQDYNAVESPDKEAIVSEKLARWMKRHASKKEEVKQPESSHRFDYTHHPHSAPPMF
jgi:hypothetical protein